MWEEFHFVKFHLTNYEGAVANFRAVLYKMRHISWLDDQLVVNYELTSVVKG